MGNTTSASMSLWPFMPSGWLLWPKTGPTKLRPIWLRWRRFLRSKKRRLFLRALAQFPSLRAWLSFTCQDVCAVVHGEGLAECAALLDAPEQVVAVGINCTQPRFVAALIRRGEGRQPAKPIFVYPNSGETWDADGPQMVWDFGCWGVRGLGRDVVCGRSSGGRRVLPDDSRAYPGGSPGVGGMARRRWQPNPCDNKVSKP